MYGFLLSTEAENSIEVKNSNCSACASSVLSEDFKTIKCWGGHDILQFLDTTVISHSTVSSVFQWLSVDRMCCILKSKHLYISKRWWLYVLTTSFGLFHTVVILCKFYMSWMVIRGERSQVMCIQGICIVALLTQIHP